MLSPFASSNLYSCDSNGNLLTKADPTLASAAAYGYNKLNQLVSVTANGTTASYTYNAQGIRTSKLVDGKLTRYLLDGGNVVAEVTDSVVTATYLWGANLISQTIGESTNYYLYNAHGDVVQLTDSAGSITKTYTYDAFGNETDPDETDTNPFRYCGEYFDTETGTYYLRARYYDPVVGRFTQSDSVLLVTHKMPNGQEIIDPLSLNLYTYCANNPVAYHDPSGHYWETILDILGFCLSARDYIKDPTQANLAFLLWDVFALAAPVPGSYAAKGIKALDKIDDVSGFLKYFNRIDDVADSVKIVNRLDDGVDIVQFVSQGNRLVGSYRDMKKYTAGYCGAIQAHHLLEQRFSLALGFNVDDMISVVLTREQHKVFTERWRLVVPYGQNYGELYKSWDDIRGMAEAVYYDCPELFKLLDDYMNSLG